MKKYLAVLIASLLIILAGCGPEMALRDAAFVV